VSLVHRQQGLPGTYPPLKGSGVVVKDDATKHIHVVLGGLQGAKAGGGVLYAAGKGQKLMSRKGDSG
jgi:hypothetical protein